VCTTCLLAMMCRCGFGIKWSMTKVKVMWVCVDGPEAVKDNCWVLTEGLEKPSDRCGG
jgi:hypothetical protein